MKHTATMPKPTPQRMKAASLWVRVALLCFAAGLLVVPTVEAQSPPNLLNSIPDPSTMSTIADIENAFNTLRRNEEQQLGAPTNSIRDLKLPANWDTLSDEAKGFFLINDARMARAGVPYTGVTPIGLPFEMVESHLQQIATARNEHMVANNYWDHDGPKRHYLD